MPAVTVVLSRSHETRPERHAFEDTLSSAFASAGCEVLVVPHIYYHTPTNAAAIRLSQIENRVIFLAWLHPRAIEWTLRALGIDKQIIAQCCDLRTFASVQECLDAIIPADGLDRSTSARVEEVAAPVSERWYPVLDYTRCVACKQCFGFCLFGVYAVAGDRVVANQPDNCKNGCPACARVCPQGAIIFPHCDDPAIAGAPDVEISRKPDAIKAVLERARHKRTAPEQNDHRQRDDLDDLIDALEGLDD